MLCLVLLALTVSVSAVSAEAKSVTVKSAQNLFEPFSRTAKQGDSFDVAINLKSDMMVVDGTVELSFDSSCMKVASYTDGDKIHSFTNITDERQNNYGNVISAFTAGAGYYDFSSGDTLISFSFTVINEPDGNEEITVDIKNLIANKTYVKDDKTVDIDVDGDVKLISQSAVAGDGFSVNATFNPLKGDFNMDNVVNINDVTELQLALVNNTVLSDAQKNVADVYIDAKINIRDATMIQLFLAGLKEFL